MIVSHRSNVTQTSEEDPTVLSTHVPKWQRRTKAYRYECGHNGSVRKKKHFHHDKEGTGIQWGTRE
jgi:hypothetical protein